MSKTAPVEPSMVGGESSFALLPAIPTILFERALPTHNQRLPFEGSGLLLIFCRAELERDNRSSHPTSRPWAVSAFPPVVSEFQIQGCTSFAAEVRLRALRILTRRSMRSSSPLAETSMPLCTPVSCTSNESLSASRTNLVFCRNHRAGFPREAISRRKALSNRRSFL